MFRLALVLATVFAASAIGCCDVGLGGRYGSLTYPRADARPVERGLVSWAFTLPTRDGRFAIEVDLVKSMNDEKSGYVNTYAGTRWFTPLWNSTARKQDGGAFVGLGLAYVNMRLETWDGSVSGRDQSLGGYVSCGIAEVGEAWPVSIEFRYTFATELDLLGGKMNADGAAIVLSIGLD